MVALTWTYEVLLFAYTLSLLGYIIDFIQNNWKLNRLSFWLLSFVWIIHTVLLYNQAFTMKRFPVLALHDSLFFYAWILITFSLIINRLFQVHFIVLFTNLFSFFILLLSISLQAKNQVYDRGAQLVHEILMVHITLTIVSYSFLTISFLLALMYLLQHRVLKEKSKLRWIWRFSDLNKLDNYSYLAVMAGVPLLLIGLTFGFVWAYVSGDEFYWFDLKTVGSIILLIIYTVYLLLRGIRGHRGKPISIYNVVAFLILLLNLFLFSLLSGFHNS